MKKLKSNKEVVEFFCKEVFNNHDLSVLDVCMRDDYVQHNPNVATGKAGFVEFFRKTFKDIPDFKCNIKKIITDGDIVAVYSSTTGTHTGPWIAPKATGNKLNYDVVDIFRVQDGMIAEHWDVADTFKLFQQVGAMEQKLTQKP